jgi:hypothetical protein
VLAWSATFREGTHRAYPVLVGGEVVMGLFLMALGAGGLYQLLAPARAIWRGHTDRVPWGSQTIGVTPRTYGAFLVWVVPTLGGVCLLSITLLLGSIVVPRDPLRPLFGTSVALVLGGPILGLLHLAVSLFGRPRWLIPPPWRTQDPVPGDGCGRK